MPDRVSVGAWGDRDMMFPLVEFAVDVVRRSDTTLQAFGVFDGPLRDSAQIRLRLIDDFRDPDPEAYELVVDDEAITIQAAAPAGLFYGLQTLRQLLATDGSRVVPAAGRD